MWIGRAQLRADDDQLSVAHGWFGAPQCSETLPSRSLGQLGRHDHGARKASRSRNDPRGELDAPHSRDVIQQRPTVPAKVGWCLF